MTDSAVDAPYRVATMSRADLDRALDWAAAEGWNPGREDAACFHAADPGGFLMGWLGDEPIASISVVRYGAAYAFLGLYIVRPEHRGRGYGLRLWNAGLEHLAGRTIGLDGVIAQQENYRRSGFVLAHRDIRYEGRSGPQPRRDPRLVPLATLPASEVLAHDRAHYPAERAAFLRCWLEQPASTALGLVEGGRLAGSGAIRPCRVGHKIGPLFADTPAHAEAIFAALAASVPPDDPVYLDVPDVNAAGVELAQRHGMTPVFECARMYRGPAPELPLERVFGITTLELG